MAEYNTVQSGARPQDAAIDQGLRAHMNKVYGLMSAALLATFALAYIVAQSPSAQQVLLVPPIVYAVIFGPLAFVLVAGFAFERLSVAAINMIFWAYAALTGVSLSVIFIMFSMSSVIMGLLYTAIAFLGLSLTGYLTKRNLGPIGQVATMMAWGIVAIALFSAFTGGMGAAGAWWMNLAILGVFAVLTATSTQDIKNTYLGARYQGGQDAELFLEKAAIIGALQLYISFIAMFRSIMFLFMPRD
ncbi:Bax inhibitor-1/YccA family protein [uncultured Lentibacter sp.]|uniref:Bax inhibitor-1/YccA family protein n=1 Tax=uncultured Lentibacter sp. TaxID=1659309 RepID=UPI00261CEB07|nr:Bax inhibitor-1/YccA family protein [uncultured Lentibacter sp.]MCW1956017.1 Bax inhibitor-1/YccA family protein [Roseobacter sp.]